MKHVIAGAAAKAAKAAGKERKQAAVWYKEEGKRVISPKCDMYCIIYPTFMFPSLLRGGWICFSVIIIII